jgi:gluconolactonase
MTPFTSLKPLCSIALVTIVGVVACTDNGNPSGDSDTSGGVSGTGTSGSAGAAVGGSAQGGSGGAAAGGAAGSGVTGGASGVGGTNPGGASGTGGTAGTPAGGAGGSSAGTGGSPSGGAGGTPAGGAAGSTSGGGSGGAGLYTCPSGVTGMPLPASPTVTRVAGVPSMFGTSSSSNVEGPVWINGSLYVSHIQEGVTNPPPSRILKITGTTAEEFLLDAGTNGLAVNAMGAIVGARHSTGDVATLNMTTKTFTPIAGQYMSTRFNSPNDLAIRRDGNIYFSDPDFQAGSTRQSATRVYRINPAGMVSVVDASISNPNGVTLSLDQNTLYVATSGNLYRYTVMMDGTTSTSTMVNGAPGSDGMAIDCAGNLYLTNGNQHRIDVITSAGTAVGTISMGIPNEANPTNVAFGGDNHQRLYITTRGSGANGAGLYYIDLNIPGMPY